MVLVQMLVLAAVVVVVVVVEEEEEEEACLATAEILATNGRDFEVALCVTPL